MVSGRGSVARIHGLTVFVSEDDGKTWPKTKMIRSGPIGCGYSDLAVLPDKTILSAQGIGKGFGAGAGLALTRFKPRMALGEPGCEYRFERY